MIKRREDTEADLARYNTMIGKVVRKRSGKPFKSREKHNTVTGITVAPITQNAGFTFIEDDSIVECWRCIEVIND